MAIYAVGDIQGHLEPLLELLDMVDFNRQRDQLWLTGDLVNRGPQSLETLRFVRDLGSSAVTVLGNHDLHLLAIAAGVRGEKAGDTLGTIFTAPDCEELIHWLRRQPLVHVDPSINSLMVHAGVFPLWDEQQLLEHAGEFRTAFQGDHYVEFLGNLNGSKQVEWRPDLTSLERNRFTFNACTRMRFCTPDGKLDLDFKGEPGPRAKSLIPWYEHPAKRCTERRIIFGHWSALGHRDHHNAICLDSGCIWGRKLTLIRLDKEERIRQIACEHPTE
ncbi:MAG: symmetrical bis(5'-nucleosyl)-tetraphosphatase [Desulfobulbaceae bacterium]|nr:symmetrical bis(5'-nucleosyl)-tetraphosphatase [Desulfobulbaceae bacterium]